MKKEIEEALKEVRTCYPKLATETWEEDCLYKIQSYIEELENREIYLIDKRDGTITMPQKQFNKLEKELINKTNKLKRIEEVVEIVYFYEPRGLKIEKIKSILEEGKE